MSNSPERIMCRINYDGTHDGHFIAVPLYAPQYEPPIEYSGNDPQYIRDDIYQALTAERDALAAEVERLRGALTVYSDKVSEYAHEDPAISDLAYDWLNEDGGRQARAALEEGKDG